MEAFNKIVITPIADGLTEAKRNKVNCALTTKFKGAVLDNRTPCFPDAPWSAAAQWPAGRSWCPDTHRPARTGTSRRTSGGYPRGS